LWTFDHVAKALTAEDEEATWLTETELLEAPIPRRHLAAVRPHAPGAATPATSAPGTGESDDAREYDELSPGDALLAELAERRGTREPVEMEEEDEDDAFEGFGPRRGAAPSLPKPPAPIPRTTMPHPAGSARENSSEIATSRPGDSSASDSPDKRQRKGRASIPSWDEIVFGAKND
jgi:hypothetical protein